MSVPHSDKVVIILKSELKNELVAQLEQVAGDETLKQYIEGYKKVLESKGIEVFQTFDYFLVCEDSIYIALYEDEYEDYTHSL